MNLENYTYQQNKFVRYFVLTYLLIIVIGCAVVYFGESGIPDILVIMNLPIAILIFASFSKEDYMVIQDNSIVVFNTFKAKKAELKDIKKVEPVAKSWVLHLKNKQKINLSQFRIAKKDKTKFRNQMSALRDYLKKIEDDNKNH